MGDFPAGLLICLKPTPAFCAATWANTCAKVGGLGTRRRRLKRCTIVPDVYLTKEHNWGTSLSCVCVLKVLTCNKSSKTDCCPSGVRFCCTSVPSSRSQHRRKVCWRGRAGLLMPCGHNLPSHIYLSLPLGLPHPEAPIVLQTSAAQIVLSDGYVYIWKKLEVLRNLRQSFAPSPEDLEQILANNGKITG